MQSKHSLSQNKYFCNLYEFRKRRVHALIVGKLENRCFCWYPAAILVFLKGTPTWRFHTKLYKFRLTVFPNISHLKYFTDLILGKGFCIFIFFHFPDSSPSVLNGLHFYFSLHDSASRELLKNYSKI